MRQIIALLFSGFFIFPVVAENTTKEYKVTKEWKVDANTAFELIAKNQNFRVELWDKETVKIDFVLSPGASKISEDDFIHGLKVNAEKSGNKFSVNTNLDNITSTSIWNWIFTDKKDKDNYKLNNTIYLPKNIASANFTIDYCDLTIGEINLPVRIITNYGNVSVLKNKNRTVIAATYTDFKLGDLSYLKTNASYCDFILNNIDTLYMGSNYGDIKAVSCPLIQSLTMNYGNITLQKAGSVKIISTYSDIKINSLTQDVNATLTYSDFKLTEIAKSISGISITGTYTDCSLKINPENPVNLVINDVNGDITMKNTQLIITKKHEMAATTNMTAKTKSATDVSPTIKINTNNSDLIIN